MDVPARVRSNVEAVRERIRAACLRAGRDPRAVTLVGVTKAVGEEAARSLVAAGVRDLGENRVQAAASRVEALADLPVRWHLIGHLQRNKAAGAARLFHCFHALDGDRVAETLDAAAARAGRRIPVLLEVNVSGEPSKHGVAPSVASSLLEAARRLTYLEAVGLMTMAPRWQDPGEVRAVFRGLAALARDLGGEAAGLRHLSMGMSEDFEVAVEEGATMVRIGTALFEGLD
ncbi:MAG: YggS family pyridoxal phosphate-dependent enzyme [Planctomycetes bacterium]|nr:YggS family pyridoxal phosphate-dependent enzyme [Planctomycetota bacterium]